MPLSEREQQILDEIERTLHSDPSGPVRDPGVARPSGEKDRIKLAAFIFIVGIALLVAFFVSSLVPIGVLAFGAMVAAIVIGASGISRFFSAGSEEDDGKTRAQRAFSQWEERLRKRYRGD